MTASVLARSYLEKAVKRLKILHILLNDKAYSDVVREAQEVVELALKGMLRQVGVEPPKFHDVGRFLIDNKSKFDPEVQETIPTLAGISAWLRKEREFSFYGDIDFIPTEQYSVEDARRAIADAQVAVEAARKVIH
jgi:HEPN domain-containing protein